MKILKMLRDRAVEVSVIGAAATTAALAMEFECTNREDQAFCKNIAESGYNQRKTDLDWDKAWQIADCENDYPDENDPDRALCESYAESQYEWKLEESAFIRDGEIQQCEQDYPVPCGDSYCTLCWNQNC